MSISSGSMWIAALLFSLLYSVSSQVVRIPLQKRRLARVDSVTVKRTLTEEAPEVTHRIDFEYYDGFVGVVRIGKPPKEYHVKFDTGTSVLVLFGEEMEDEFTNDVDEFSHALYRPSESEGYFKYRIKDMQSFKYKFIDGDGMYGKMGLDKVFIGDKGSKKTPIAVINRMINTSGLQLYDGILGLGLEGTQKNGAEPVFIHMTKLEMFNRQMFSMYFSPLTDGNHGEILFGGYDEAYIGGPLLWVEMSSLGKWQVKVDACFVARAPMGTDIQVVIGSGTEYFHVSEPVLNALVESSGAKWDRILDHYVVDDCDLRGSFGNLDFRISGELFSFSGVEYIRLRDGVCQLMVKVVGDLMEEWVFGVPFIRKYYTVFDYGNKKLGFSRTASQHHNNEHDNGLYSAPMDHVMVNSTAVDL